MNSSESILDSSFFRATKAYMEKHEAAIFNLEPPDNDSFNSLPKRVFILSITCIRSP